MERLDPKRAFGNFIITTCSGTRYEVAARRSRVTGSFAITSPNEKDCYPTAFVHCDREPVFKRGVPMRITAQGGRRSYVTTPITSIELEGVPNIKLEEVDDTYVITTEEDGTFSLITEAETYGRCLLQHDRLYPDCNDAYLGSHPDTTGVVEVGKPLFVFTPHMRPRDRAFSRVISIVPQ